jgi:hypothetical protein
MIRTSIFLFIILILIEVNHLSAAAQQPSRWSPQERIPGYADGTQPPYLIADRNRTVHAFTSQQVDEDSSAQVVIIYNQWTLEKGWTTPIDILLSPLGQARIQGVYLDQAGMIHLIFFGGNDQAANIYYSRAPITDAGQASAWSKPELVGKEAVTPANAALAGDSKGNLVVIYSGNQNGNGIYAVYSADGGDTWSDSESIFSTYSDELWPFDFRLYMGQSGKLYAVWNVVNKLGHGESGQYAKLDIEHRQWSDPIEFAAGVWLGVLNPNVIEYDGDIIIVYYNGDANANWWRRSNDGGQTWTAPVRAAPRHIGTNGIPSLVVDSNNGLYMLFGQRINDLNHGMWHSVWQGNSWSEAEAIISGPRRVGRYPGDADAFDPNSTSAVISQGNILLVTWATDPGAVQNGVWYSFKTLDTPELPAVALPTQVVRSIATPNQTTTPSWPTPTTAPVKPILSNFQSSDSSVYINNPATPLVISFVSVAVLISIIIIIRRLRYMNH